MVRKSVLPLVIILAMLAGCDKKASVGTVGLMDSAARQSTAVAALYASQDKYAFAGDDVASLQDASNDIKGTLEQIALGFDKGNAALNAKKSLSIESAKQIENTVATLSATLKVIKRLQTFMRPKVPEDDAALVAWKAQVVADLDVLIATVTKLDASVKADMAAAKK